MASLTEIKNWFKTGLKPSQAQFWATWDSFWHKDTPIPQSAIENLEETLTSIGSGGGRFGIEDNSSETDRGIDMDTNKFNFNNVGEFNLGGNLLSNVLIPYDGNTMYFEQINMYYPGVSLVGKSLLFINRLPIEGTVMNVYFTIDGSPAVKEFTLSSTEGMPVWITDEIQGEVVIPLNINPLMDTSQSTIGFSKLNIKSPGTVVFVGNNENMWFSQTNQYTDVPSWNGKSMVGAQNVYENDISQYPETITARLNIDGVISDMEFTLEVQYSADWGETLYRWVRPEVAGDIINIIGILKVDFIAQVYMTLPNTEYTGQKIVVKDVSGALSYASLDDTPPSIDEVLSFGNYAYDKTLTLTANAGTSNLSLAASGISVGYRANDYYFVRQSGLDIDGLSFYHASNDTNLNQKIVPNYSQNSNNAPVEVTMPLASGHMLLKNQLSKLVHRTVSTTTVSMNSSQWINLLEPTNTLATGDYMALENTIVYNGTANATWEIPPDSFTARKYRIINNTNNTITINRTGTTSLLLNGVSNTSIVIPAVGWAEIIGSNSENRFYFKIS